MPETPTEAPEGNGTAPGEPAAAAGEPRPPPPSRARRVLLLAPVRAVVGIVLYLPGPLLAGTLVPPDDLTAFLLAHSVASGMFALLALLVLARLVERRPLEAVGLDWSRAGRDLASGALLGAWLVSGAVGSLALAGWYRVEAAGSPGFEPLGVSVLLLAAAFGEEALFRGILFRVVEEDLGSPAALLLSGGLFGLVHLANPEASLAGAAGIAVGAGLLLGGAYMLTRSLWLAVGIHWSWNVFEGVVFGVPVSGLELPSLLAARSDGPVLWTGGAFGPEAGLAQTLVAGLATCLVLGLAHREGQFRSPGWLERRCRGAGRGGT